MKTLNIVVAILTVIGILFGLCACAWAEEYPCIFLVKALDYNNNFVTFIDITGEHWILYGIEEWNINDIAIAIMDDNKTPNNIYDDIIVMVYYQTNINN